MKQQSIALTAIIAVAIGFTGISVFADNASQPELSDMEQLAVESGIYGHMEVVQKNSEGDVIAYRQTDNVVTTQGKECAVTILFANADVATNNCPITAYPAKFDYIQLINAGTPVAGDTQAAFAGTNVSALGLTIAQCTVANTGGAGSGSVTCSKTFTAGSGVSGATVTGAYLKDSATPTSIFAGNTFTSVSMSEADTLAVTWTLTLS